MFTRLSCGLLLLLLLALPGLTSASELVTIIYMDHLVPQQAKALEPIFEKARAEIGVDVQLIYTSYGEFLDKLVAMVISGNAPDLINATNSSVFLVEEGILGGMDEYLQTGEITRTIHPPALEALTWRGELFGIPFAVNTWLQGYNRFMFDDAGLTYPPGEWDASYWTWQDYFDVAKKLTLDLNNDGTIDQWGVAMLPEMHWLPYWWGDTLLEEGAKTLRVTPAVVEAIQFFADYGPTVMSTGSLVGGTAAMTGFGSWVTIDYTKQLPDFDLAPNPRGTIAWAPAHVDGLTILRQSEQKEAAWRFITWLVNDPENLKMYNLARHGYGTLSAYMGDQYPLDYAAAYPEFQLRWQVLMDATMYLGKDVAMYNASWQEISPILSFAWSQIFGGQSSAATMLEQLRPSMDFLLRQ